MQTVNINASSFKNGIPQIVTAINAAIIAAGFGVTVSESEIAEAFAAAEPYLNGETSIPVVIAGIEGNGNTRSAVKTETRQAAPAAAPRSAHPAPVSAVNAKWNDRCGRWQNSQTGAFIPFA